MIGNAIRATCALLTLILGGSTGRDLQSPRWFQTTQLGTPDQRKSEAKVNTYLADNAYYFLAWPDPAPRRMVGPTFGASAVGRRIAQRGPGAVAPRLPPGRSRRARAAARGPGRRYDAPSPRANRSSTSRSTRRAGREGTRPPRAARVVGAPHARCASPPVVLRYRLPPVAVAHVGPLRPSPDGRTGPPGRQTCVHVHGCQIGKLASPDAAVRS